MPERPTVVATAGEHRGILAFAAAYLIGLATYGLIAGSRLTIAYAVTVVGLALVVASLQGGLRLSRGILWALAIWGFLHMAGGLIEFTDAVLYNIDWGIPVVRFDRLVHAFGFGTTTALCWQVLRNRAGVRSVTTAVAVMCWLGGMGFGALNEMVEFILSQLIDTNVGGFVNTGYDLIFNTIGCTCVAVWLRLRRAS